MSPADLDLAIASARPVSSVGFTDAVMARLGAASAVEPVAERPRRNAVWVGAAAVLAVVIVLVVVREQRDAVAPAAPHGEPAGGPVDSAALENPHGDKDRLFACSACHDLSSATPAIHAVIGGGGKIQIDAFVDLDCPTCGNAMRTLEILAVSHPDRLRITVHHVTDSLASRAALSANEQGKYWRMVELLVVNQDHSRATIDNHASAISLGLAKFHVDQFHIDKFHADLTDGAIEAMIKRDARAARDLGGPIPAFVVDGVAITGPGAITRMRARVAAALAP